jgi:hypothetical protein
MSAVVPFELLSQETTQGCTQSLGLPLEINGSVVEGNNFGEKMSRFQITIKKIKVEKDPQEIRSV